MTPERYKKLTDWLEGHPALREGIILLNRWLPLVPFVCYPALLLLLNLRWFAMLRVGRGGGALDFMQVIARAILVPGLAFWMGTRKLKEPIYRKGQTGGNERWLGINGNTTRNIKFRL